MDWDQRAFAWLYRAVRRMRGKGHANEKEAPLDALASRFETLSQLLTERKWEVRSNVGTGGVAPGTLLLPRSVPWLPDPDDLAGFYLYRVVIGVTVAQQGFGSAEARPPRCGSLAMLIRIPAAREVVRARYPGAASLLARIEPILAECFPFDERTEDARRFSIACRAILRDERYERALGELAGRPSGELASPWGLLLPPERPTPPASAPTGDPQRTLPRGTERKMPRRPADVETVDLDSQRDRDIPLVHSFEKVHTATEYESGRKQLDASDQLAAHEEALRELELSKVTRTGETAQSIYRAELQPGLHMADLADKSSPPLAYRYPEWSFKQRDYRDEWCTVNEVTNPPSSSASVAVAASRRLHRDVLRLQSELKRLELERRWRNRQLDGGEVDIDALVDRQADLLARRHPDPRIYVRRKAHDAELAMLILVDASSSSDSWVSGRRIFDVVRDSAQVLIESFAPTSARLCVASFYSNTRRDCRFSLTKDFDDSVPVGVRRLHAVSPAGYTRIGPALRHSLRLMVRSGARRRLILLLTDAKPTDYDHYEGRYGIEDVRQALREATEQGVHCLALAVRDRPDPYLTQMFGPHRWALLPAVDTLPARLVSVANDFLRG